MKLVKDLGAIGIADVVAGGIGSIFWLYLASLLTAENYGEIQYYVSLAGMAFAFSMLGTRNSILVYEVKKIQLRRTLFFITIIGGVISSIILLITYQRIDIIVLTFGMIFSELVIGYFFGKKLFAKYAIFMILQKILMISISIGFYFVIGVEGIIFGIGLSYIPYVFLIYKGFQESKFDFELLKKHSGFVANNYGLIVLGTAKGNLDKLFIAPIIGLSALGNYSLGFQVYLGMMIFTNIAFKYTLPHDASGTITNRFKITTISVSIIFAAIGAIIIPKIIPIYFPNFINSIEIIPILCLAVIPNTVSLMYSSKFLGNEKSRYVLIGILSSTSIYLILIIILAPIYNILGVSISYLISSIAYALISILLQKTQK